MIFSSYKNYTTRAALLALFLAMVGIIWFGIVPLKQATQAKMRGIQEFYARRENREKQLARLPELKVQYSEILQDEKTLNILISDDAVVDFVKTLEGLANDTHVEMSIAAKDNGKIAEPKKTPPKPVQPVSDDSGATSPNTAKPKVVNILDDIPFDRYLYLNVKVRGMYEDIVVFLHQMETLPVGLDVIKVDMKKAEVESTAGAVSGNGINPFLVSGDSAPAVTPEPVATDVFEAVFDVVIYVNKNN